MVANISEAPIHVNVCFIENFICFWLESEIHVNKLSLFSLSLDLRTIFRLRLYIYVNFSILV